jgi:hypothetical protein
MGNTADDYQKKIEEIGKKLEEEPELLFHNPEKFTQGKTKILRLIDDLIRNKLFLRSLKRVIREQDKWRKRFEKGNYYAWTKEEQAEHDYFNKEAGEIIEEYQKLKKRTKKLMHTREYKIKQKIAWRYGLDSYLINLAIAKYKKDAYSVASHIDEGGDMCRVHSDYQDEVMPLNTGEDFSKMNAKKQLGLIAYPVSIGIHRNATKRDVLDFIEKEWWIVNNALKDYEEKPYRARKRKHDQKMLDFIWENRSLPATKLKDKLDVEFPKNGIAYFEVSKLVQLEKQKRLGYFEI